MRLYWNDLTAVICDYELPRLSGGTSCGV